jgi:hypothetical protein
MGEKGREGTKRKENCDYRRFTFCIRLVILYYDNLLMLFSLCRTNIMRIGNARPIKSKNWIVITIKKTIIISQT